MTRVPLRPTHTQIRAREHNGHSHTHTNTRTDMSEWHLPGPFSLERTHPSLGLGEDGLRQITMFGEDLTPENPSTPSSVIFYPFRPKSPSHPPPPTPPSKGRGLSGEPIGEQYTPVTRAP